MNSIKMTHNVPGLAEGVDLVLCPPGPEVEFIIKS